MMPCETQRAVRCHLRHINQYCGHHLNKHHDIKYENVWTNDIIIKIKCSNCLLLAVTEVTHVLSLNRHSSIAWTMIVMLNA